MLFDFNAAAVVKKIAIVYHCFTVEGHRRSGAFEQF